MTTRTLLKSSDQQPKVFLFLRHWKRYDRETWNLSSTFGTSINADSSPSSFKVASHSVSVVGWTTFLLRLFYTNYFSFYIRIISAFWILAILSNNVVIQSLFYKTVYYRENTIIVASYRKIEVYFAHILGGALILIAFRCPNLSCFSKNIRPNCSSNSFKQSQPW